MPALIRQTHPLQSPDGPLMPLLARHTGIEQRQLHILLNSQLGNEVILLENESQHPVADLGLLVIIHGGHIHPAQMIGARGGHIQAADDIHGRGLSRSGGAHHRHKLSPVNGQAHTVQGVDLLVAHGIDLIDVSEFNEMLHGSQPPI